MKIPIACFFHPKVLYWLDKAYCLHSLTWWMMEGLLKTNDRATCRACRVDMRWRHVLLYPSASTRYYRWMNEVVCAGNLCTKVRWAKNNSRLLEQCQCLKPIIFYGAPVVCRIARMRLEDVWKRKRRLELESDYDGAARCEESSEDGNALTRLFGNEPAIDFLLQCFRTCRRLN